MKISMHQASAPRFANALRNLSGILDKAQAWAEAKKIDAAVPGGLRLIADMFPLSRQVQIACDTAKGAVARLAGVEGGVQECGAHAQLAQRVDLVLHQRDQRRDDDADAIAQQRRNLVAQRLAAAGGHQHQRVAAAHHVLDHLGLMPAKRGIAENFL